MFSQKFLQNNKISSLKCSHVMKRYLKEAITLPPISQETKLALFRKQKPERISFLRALILGKIDNETFTYPELDSPRYEDYCKWINPIENYISNCVNKKMDKKEILDNLRDLEVFRTHINNKYFGLTLSNTETLQLVEILSNLPWLGTYALKNHIIPVEIINKYGSESQKLEYFPRIMSGDIIPTICIYEGGYGTNINSIKTFMMQQTTDSWILNGEKEFVVNGINSNLFLVFTKYVAPVTGKIKSDSFSLLLVERDFGNISCTNVCDTIGRHETPTCTIKFNDTVVPHKNIIGTPGGALDILMEYLKPGRQHITGQAISILRNFLNLITSDIIQMKHFDRDLHTFDIVKKILGEITFSLYTMESMAYLTTGMIDQYENMNADLEQIITETYCANKCLQCVQAGLQLMGAKSYMNNKSYIDAFHDAMALTTMDINNLDSVTYVASSVFQLLGNKVTDHIHKKRNIFQYPVYNMIDKMLNKYAIKLNAEYVHPSYTLTLNCLEESINKFKNSILLLLEERGSAVMEQYSDMLRITFILTEIYATFANIIRASRSCAIGTRNSDLEKDLVTQMTYLSYTKISLLKEEIDLTKAFNGDSCYISIMDLSYEHHKYPLAHPLTKTF